MLLLLALIERFFLYRLDYHHVILVNWMFYEIISLYIFYYFKCVCAHVHKSRLMVDDKYFNLLLAILLLNQFLTA